MNKEVVEPNWKMLEAMTMCSDNSFEGWIKAKLKTLIAMNEEGKHKR